jgi:hypothetical protein
MTDDRHSPTTAGPSPTPSSEPPPAEATPTEPTRAEPTPAVTVVPAGDPPGAAADEPSELPFGIPPDRPEILVGAAFAGGLVAAFILRRLGGD